MLMNYLFGSLIFYFFFKGNSPTQLQKQISELHNSVWASKMVQYSQDCKLFSVAAKSRLLSPSTVEEPPKQLAVPTYQWFIDVYCQEVTGHIDELKAAITSTFGKILKMDSTKKVKIIYVSQWLSLFLYLYEYIVE